MKPFNLNPNPHLKKWALAVCLLIALGTNLSFNPDTKTIARNDGIDSGMFSMASSTGEPVDDHQWAEGRVPIIAAGKGMAPGKDQKKEVKPSETAAPKAEPQSRTALDSSENAIPEWQTAPAKSARKSKTQLITDLSKDANREESTIKSTFNLKPGINIKATFFTNKEGNREAVYILEKDGTEAGICGECLEAIEVQKMTIAKEMVDFSERAVKAAALALLKERKIEAKVSVVDKDDKDDEEDPKYKKKYRGKHKRDEDDRIDLSEYTCNDEDDFDGTLTDISARKSCLTEEAQKLKDDCKDKIEEEYQAAKKLADDKAKKDGTKKRYPEKDRKYCKALMRKFHEREVKPSIKLIRSAQIQEFSQNYENALLSKVSDLKWLYPNLSQQELVNRARKELQWPTANAFQNLIYQDMNPMVKDSLANISNRFAISTNDKYYNDFFNREYALPMKTTLNDLSSTTKVIDVAALLRRASGGESLLGDSSISNSSFLGLGSGVFSTGTEASLNTNPVAKRGGQWGPIGNAAAGAGPNFSGQPLNGFDSGRSAIGGFPSNIFNGQNRGPAPLPGLNTQSGTAQPTIRRQ